jgi:hypothetical protein
MAQIGGTIGQPARHEAIRVLLRAGKNDEAIAALTAILAAQPNDVDALYILFDALFQKHDWTRALNAIEILIGIQPQELRFRKALILTLSNMRRYDDAIARGEEYLAEHGEDMAVLDVLKVANFYLGKVPKAAGYGQRVLELRDKEACRNPPKMTMTEPTGRAGRNVISFSLWGPAPFYSYGAMINLVLARTVYPGWTCRFYIDRMVPAACVSFLKENGAEIFYIEDEYPGVGLFQRFLVMNDPSVARFLVRDCDARLTPGEAELTKEWLNSSFPFHAIRDHILHNELMIGCLWSGRTDCGIDIVELMRRYFVHGPTAKYGHDQRMLGHMLWPLIRSRCLVHDKYYMLPGVHTVLLRDTTSRFGAGHQNMNAVLKEVDSLGIPRIS